MLFELISLHSSPVQRGRSVAFMKTPNIPTPFRPVTVWPPPSSQEAPILHEASHAHPIASRARRAPGPTPTTIPLPSPPLPLGCSWGSNTTAAGSDDDDDVSVTLSWPESLHCSNAGLTAVPVPLPTSLRYMQVLSCFLTISCLYGVTPLKN